jgi:hypothetical protein
VREEQAAYTCGSQEPAVDPVWAGALQQRLDDLEEFLPKRRHRKVDRQRLQEFFHQTQDGWFRLRDFEHFFVLDRKTAWEYIQKFLQTGLLVHNQGRSSAVRYRVVAN